MKKKTKKVSEAQLKAIRRSYAMKKAKNDLEASKEKFPSRFPFWARLKIGKNRTTLVIDEDVVYDKKKKKDVDGFVHREATHPNARGDYEMIYPNPDKDDPDPMYLKRPRKLPKKMFKPHNKNLAMPEDLRKRYDKNNNK